MALWLATPDAQALHDHLVAAGVDIAAAPKQTPFGRAFTFVGPEGYLLTAHDG
ncbi:VOC family protein [Nocardia takedensis]|uniref:VOC family protein n=1 Tax=Nocardia takedensis TaxID=259390 RepID=UPI003F75DB01